MKKIISSVLILFGMSLAASEQVIKKESDSLEAEKRVQRNRDAYIEQLKIERMEELRKKMEERRASAMSEMY